MGYIQSKKAALDETGSLNMRYKGLLRCISRISKVRNGNFKELLELLDTGINTDIDPVLSSEKINSAIEQLDKKRIGAKENTLKNDRAGSLFIDTANPTRVENNNSNKIGSVSNLKKFQLLNWQFLFGFKKLKNEVFLTKMEAKKKFHSEFSKMNPLLDSVSSDVHRLLNKKLNYLSDKLAFPPQCRIKNWVSTVEKLTRINSNIGALTEIQDLIGLRVVTLFEKDLPLIEKIIEKNFKVQRRYRPAYLAAIGDNSSKHLVIRLPVKNAYASYKLDSVLAEIQIMSLTQFTYARVSHSLLYKNESTSNRSIRDSLARVSALLQSVEIELHRNFDDSNNR
jgi:ppGpp synthetase/RelA/SpoT-type nucleotidyltranferase